MTDAAGLANGAVPIALALFGVGAFLGVWSAGRVADRHWRTLLAAGLPLLLLGWVVFALLAAAPAALFAFMFVQGALSFAVGSTLIGRVMASASGAPTMGGSFATAALNVGAMLGPVLAGLGYAAAGPAGPLWVSSALVCAAAVLGALRARGVSPWPGRARRSPE